jgi:hypothetical protein
MTRRKIPDMPLHEELAAALRLLGREELAELLGVRLILEEVRRMAVSVDQLVADFETYHQDVSNKLDELKAELDAALANEGGIPAEVQAKLDELDAAVQTADQSLTAAREQGVEAPAGTRGVAPQAGTLAGQVATQPAGTGMTTVGGQPTVPVTDATPEPAGEGVVHSDGSVAPVDPTNPDSPDAAPQGMAGQPSEDFAAAQQDAANSTEGRVTTESPASAEEAAAQQDARQDEQR